MSSVEGAAIGLAGTQGALHQSVPVRTPGWQVLKFLAGHEIESAESEVCHAPAFQSAKPDTPMVPDRPCRGDRRGCRMGLSVGASGGAGAVVAEIAKATTTSNPNADCASADSAGAGPYVSQLGGIEKDITSHLGGSFPIPSTSRSTA